MASESEKEKKKSTKFTSDNQPDYSERATRGRNKSTLLWEAMERRAFEKTEESDSYKLRIQAEREFYDEWVAEAYKGIAAGENYLFGLMINRLHPQSKATNDTVEFKFPVNGTAVEKADAIFDAISCGDLAPDVGVMLIQAINVGVNIEDVTILKQKIDAIEAAMKADA